MNILKLTHYFKQIVMGEQRSALIFQNHISELDAIFCSYRVRHKISVYFEAL